MKKKDANVSTRGIIIEQNEKSNCWNFYSNTNLKYGK